MFDDYRCAFSTGNIDAVGHTDGRCVDLGDALEVFALVDGFAGEGVEAGEVAAESSGDVNAVAVEQG